MNRAPQRTVVAAAALAITILAAGCHGTPQPAPSISGLASASTSATPISQAVNLKGLSVTVEITAAPGPDITPGASVQTSAPAPEGTTRLTLYSRAVNSTDGTLALRIEHNYPALHDAKGNLLPPIAGGGLSARGILGSKFTTAQEGLRPGGVLETVQSFDVRRGPIGLQYTWDFGDLGVARFTLP